MSLVKETKIDRIEVVENGVINVRESTKIVDDGVEIASTYHRQVLTPGTDVSNQTDLVKNICAVVWTQDIITAYRALVDSAFQQA